MKKFLAIVLSIAMILCTMGTVAFAADEIRVTSMEELTAAVLQAAASDNGTTIVLAPGEYQGLGFTGNTIRGKNINFKGEVGAVVESSGYGIYMPWFTGTIENIVFTDNGKDIDDYQYSALIFAQDTNMGSPCDLTFVNCDFITTYPGNSAIHFAGDVDFYSCDFVGTDSYAAMNYCCPSGDGIVIDNCTFSGNYAFASIHLAEGAGADVVISNCDISTGCIEFGSPKNITIKDNNLDTPVTLWSENKAIFDGNTFGENVVISANADAAQAIILPTNSGDAEFGSNGNGEVVAAVAKNVTTGAYYPSINDAIDAAKDGDTITILPGTYNAFTVPAEKNNLTIAGDTDAEGNNLVKIVTLMSVAETQSRGVSPADVVITDEIDTHTKGIFVQAETTTIKNLDIIAGTTGTTWMSSSIGNTNGDTGASSNLKFLTVENCNMTGSGVYSAIWTKQGNITVRNCNISNYSTAVDVYAITAGQTTVITDSEISDVNNAFHTGEAQPGSQINVSGTVIDSNVIEVGGGVSVNVTDSEIKNAAVTTHATSSMNIKDSKLYDTTYNIYPGSTSTIDISENYVNNVNQLAATAEENTAITFNSYHKTPDDYDNDVLTNVPAVADAIEVDFEYASEEETSLTYNVVLKGINAKTINRLNSADLTFYIEQIKGKNVYEIVDIANDNITFNPVYNVADGSIIDGRYEFHFEHKNNVTNDTGAKLVIAQVKFTGYGEFNFGVKTAKENIVNTTTIGDNIVEYYVPVNNGETIENGELVIDNYITGAEIAIPRRALTVKVSFPNGINENDAAYQNMTLSVVGDGISETVKLGYGLRKDANGVVYYEVPFGDTILNTPYTVTLEGAGYRTVKYTVNMTEAKTLNFWNNVKDNDVYVEEGLTTGTKKYAQKVTFLAGDIVKDNNINVYDLSAVVSYFGEINLAKDNKPGYAKYDLNRDGKVDSKDVAYVLVSWGN